MGMTGSSALHRSAQQLLAIVIVQHETWFFFYYSVLASHLIKGNFCLSDDGLNNKMFSLLYKILPKVNEFK